MSEPRRLIAEAFQHWHVGRYEEAERIGRRLIAHRDQSPQIRVLFTLTRLAVGDVEAATRWSQEALTLGPDNPHARGVHGMCLLARGNPAGWSWCNHPRLRRTIPESVCSAPPWDGSPLEGRSIAVYSYDEGGLGDVLLQVRLLQYLRSRGAGRVTVVVTADHSPLAPLLAAQEYVDAVGVDQEPGPPADLYTVFSDLAPLLSGTGEIAVGGAGYLAVPPHPIQDYVRALPGLRVGIVWGGGVPIDRHETFGRLCDRNVALRQLAPLWRVPGVSWVSLQKGPQVADLAAEPEARERLHDLSGRLDDLAVTAAALRACDLLVSIDTGVANMAGTMGHPAWVLLHDQHDQRWYGPDLATTYTYPGVALFRQERGTGWAPVIDAIARDLRRAAAAAPGPERERLLRHPSEAGFVPAAAAPAEERVERRELAAAVA